MMTKNHDQSIEINDIPNWPYIPDHPHRILIICRSRLLCLKFNYISKTHSNQSINCFLMEEKKSELKN